MPIYLETHFNQGASFTADGSMRNKKRKVRPEDGQQGQSKSYWRGHVRVVCTTGACRAAIICKIVFGLVVLIGPMDDFMASTANTSDDKVHFGLGLDLVSAL